REEQPQRRDGNGDRGDQEDGSRFGGRSLSHRAHGNRSNGRVRTRLVGRIKVSLLRSLWPGSRFVERGLAPSLAGIIRAGLWTRIAVEQPVVTSCRGYPQSEWTEEFRLLVSSERPSALRWPRHAEFFR